MAEINFRPVCSNCGSVLCEVIDAVLEDAAKELPRYKLVPSQCPHCGANIEMITLPKMLPYDGIPDQNKKPTIETHSCENCRFTFYEKEEEERGYVH